MRAIGGSPASRTTSDLHLHGSKLFGASPVACFAEESKEDKKGQAQSGKTLTITLQILMTRNAT